MNDPGGGLVLIGGGGHCKSVLDAVLRINIFRDIVITDPGIPKGTQILGCEVVGGDEVLPDLYRKGFTKAFITIGSIKSTRLRRKSWQTAREAGFSFPTIVDPSAVVSETAVVGAGVFIGKNAVVNADAVIGDHAIINTGTFIEHECRIGAFSHVAVGAVLCGNVTVGEDAFIGANATVVQEVTVGRGSVTGAGSVILADVPEQAKVYGRLSKKCW